MEIDYLKIKYIDDCMTKFLQLYVENGKSVKYGALLAKSFPASRLLFNPPATMRLPKDPLTATATIFSASVVSDVPGIFVLTIKVEKRPFDSWKAWKPDDSQISDITCLQFLDILKSGDPFGTRFEHVRLSQMDTGRQFGLIRWPFRMRDEALKTAAAAAAYPDLRSSTIIILDKASPFKVQIAEANLHAVYYHHRGSPVQWIVVPPQGKLLFESKLRAALSLNDQPLCSQFVSHMNIWIHSGFLRDWNIGYYEIEQRAGQMVFFFPGSYIWGYGLGFAIIEKRNLGGNTWKISQGAFCGMNTDACRVANPRGLPYQLSQEDYDAIESHSSSLADSPIKKKKENSSLADSPIKKRKEKQNVFVPYVPQQDLASPPANRYPDKDQDLYQNSSSMYNDEIYVSDGDEGFTFLTLADQDEDNSVLHDQLRTLLTERQYQRIRKEAYKECLLKREKYIFHLELEVQKLEPFEEFCKNLDQLSEGQANGEVQPSPWKEVAMKAYRATVERDTRIKQLEGEVSAAKSEKGRLTHVFEQKRQHVAAQNENRIEELEDRLRRNNTRADLRINDLAEDINRITAQKNRLIRELEVKIRAIREASTQF